MSPPSYIGDAVYAQYDRYNRLVLTTGSHREEEAENVIVLEPEVWNELLRYVNDNTEAPTP